MKRALVALALVLAACRATPARAPTRSTTSTRPVATSVRIGVWLPADPQANTYGGAAVRELIYPQLFRATPTGNWAPSLVEPRSHATLADNTEAHFRFRRGAKWSDGSPITVADLRRTMDTRFVQSIDDPTPSGRIVVHFTQPLPDWRRLWSGLASITPPREGLFGGPYKVGAITKGLETVLVANDAYFASKPAITEVHLVLVADAEIAARLMERGELDVIAPPAFPGRTARLKRITHARVVASATSRGGWTATLIANPSRLNLEERMYLFDFADGPRFTNVLLHDEATAFTDAAHAATAARPPFPGTPALAGPQESSAGVLLLHAMQRKAHKAGFDFDLRASEFDRVLAAYAASDFDALFALQPPTLSVCWTCSYATVDATLAKAADAGDASARRALRRRLAVEAIEVRLWRERPVAAVREGLDGVTVNGFDVAGSLWDLQHWYWR